MFHTFHRASSTSAEPLANAYTYSPPRLYIRTKVTNQRKTPPLYRVMKPTPNKTRCMELRINDDNGKHRSFLFCSVIRTQPRRTHLQECIALEECLEPPRRLEVNKPRLQLRNQRLLSTTGQDVPVTPGERNGPECARCAVGQRQERDAV